MDVMKHAAFAMLLVFLSLRIANAQQIGRWFHRAALVNDTLYVYGGEVQYNTGEYIGDILALNVTKRFSTNNVPWNGLLDPGVPIASHSLTVGGRNNRFLISYGGISVNGSVQNVNMFDTKGNSWSTWNRRSVSVSLMKHTAVALPNASTTYVFGGYPVGSPLQERNTLLKLDTLGERIADSSNGPASRIQHTATMLDGDMYVIGGDTDGEPVSMTDIYVYNTATDEWTRQTAGGQVPSPRRSHQAVAWGREIIVFGGDDLHYKSSSDSLAVLNVDTMTWSKPSTKGTPPHARSGHSMTMVGSNAIIAFGYYPGVETEQVNVFVLDVESYTWTTQYVPNSRTPPSPSPSEQRGGSNATIGATTDDKNLKSGDNIPIIVVAVLASGVVLVVAIILVVKFLRKRAYWRSTLSEFSISKDYLSNETSSPDDSVGVTKSLQSPYHSQMQPLPNDSPQAMMQPYQQPYIASNAGIPNAYPVQSPSSIPEGYAVAGHSGHQSSSYDSSTMLLSGAPNVMHGTYSMAMQGAHDLVLQETYEYDQGAHDVVAVVQGARVTMTSAAPIMLTQEASTKITQEREAPSMMTQESQSMMTQQAPIVMTQEAPSMVTQEAQNITAQGVNDVHALEQQQQQQILPVPRSTSPPTSEVVELDYTETGHRDLNSTDGTGNP